MLWAPLLPGICAKPRARLLRCCGAAGAAHARRSLKPPPPLPHRRPRTNAALLQLFGRQSGATHRCRPLLPAAALPALLARLSCWRCPAQQPSPAHTAWLWQQVLRNTSCLPGWLPCRQPGPGRRPHRRIEGGGVQKSEQLLLPARPVLPAYWPWLPCQMQPSALSACLLLFSP